MTQSGSPSPTHRLVPSQFPAIGSFDTVSTAADLVSAMELQGWTDDAMIASRLARLPRGEWVYGQPNSSIVMAAFLYVAPGGMRFNGPDLGAWYAAASLETAIAEVAHHLRDTAIMQGVPALTRNYRQYVSDPSGSYVDLRGAAARMPELYDPASYAASQAYGEALRATGGDGILFDSVRHVGGINVAAYRPWHVMPVTPGDLYGITVRSADYRIDARRLP